MRPVTTQAVGRQNLEIPDLRSLFGSAIAALDRPLRP